MISLQDSNTIFSRCFPHKRLEILNLLYLPLQLYLLTYTLIKNIIKISIFIKEIVILIIKTQSFYNFKITTFNILKRNNILHFDKILPSASTDRRIYPVDRHTAEAATQDPGKHGGAAQAGLSG